MRNMWADTELSLVYKAKGAHIISEHICMSRALEIKFCTLHAELSGINPSPGTFVKVTLMHYSVRLSSLWSSL